MTTDFRIERAKPEDLAAIQTIDRISYNTEHPEPWLEEGLNDPEGYYFLAYHGNEAVGYCGMYHITSKEPNFCKISTIAVLPDFQRKGLGKQMLQKILDTAEQLGLDRTKLEVGTNNVNAIALYKSFGFLIEEFHEKYYDNGNDGYIMWRYDALKSIAIRPETPADHRIVEELTRAAFSTPDRIDRSEIGCPLEHFMVHQLRLRDGIMDLNFVAELDGKIVGHIIYSHAHILQPDGTKVAVLNFGPISVCPQHQRKGIGSALMRQSIALAKQQGHGAILFFGHPDYYPRFGFTTSDKFGITDKNGNNYPAFMAMELKPGYLANASGKFIESDIFNDDLNREAAIKYDKQFHS